jgi:hypothetical protein
VIEQVRECAVVSAAIVFVLVGGHLGCRR